MIQTRLCQGKKDLCLFEEVPESFLGEDPYFVPPYPGSVAKIFAPDSPFHQRHGRLFPFLAFQEGKPVGRIAAIINRTHNRHWNDDVGFFGYFDCIDDPQVGAALFDAVKTILKREGLRKMRGPFNPSINDEVGVLSDGFDSAPFVMMTYNPPYYLSLYEKLGLMRLRDVHAYYIEGTTAPPDRIRKIVERVKKSTGVRVRNIDMGNLKTELRVINRLFNECWKDNWGFVPMTLDELESIADELKEIADPELVYIAEKDGEAVGFSLAMPNINEFMGRAKSAKGIFRKLKFIWQLKTRRPKEARLMLLGVDPKFRNKGLGAVFYYETLVHGGKKYRGGELSWILEDNHEIIAGITAMGGKRYKSYRLYENPL